MNNYFYMFLAITGARIVSEYFIEKYREYRSAKYKAQIISEYTNALDDMKKRYGDMFAASETGAKPAVRGN